MTDERGNLTLAGIGQRKDSSKPAAPVFAVALLLLGLAAFTSRNVMAEPTSEPSPASQVFELPDSVGSGPGKEVSVLIDESHLKLAILTLRQGTSLPSHSTPVPTTIQVLEGDGVIHVGDKPVSVSRGTVISLVAGEAHDVVPKPGTDMLLLVHYLRAGEEMPATEAHEH